jgi:N6-L-threonylcarbamoyladenine synthase
MLVLGLETSCDETAAALVRDGTDVLAEVLLSQVDRHRPFGGVVPELAARAHAEAIEPLVREALARAGVGPEAIDAVAVTRTPGLIGCLLVGISFAKALALGLERPLVGVDHLEAHLYAAAMGCPSLRYPCAGLIVSGGHTDLYWSRGPIDHELIDSTMDDAAGEAFDKVARILGLGFPGGPAIERAAAGCAGPGEPFAPPTMGEAGFSFSGIKTAVLYRVRGQNAAGPRGPVDTAAVAKGFQEAVVEALTDRALAVCRERGARQIAVGGGVAANGRLRRRLTERAREDGIEALFAPMRLCTDNATMVAGLGYHLARAGRVAGADLDAVATKDYRRQRS